MQYLSKLENVSDNKSVIVSTVLGLLWHYSSLKEICKIASEWIQLEIFKKPKKELLLLLYELERKCYI